MMAQDQHHQILTSYGIRLLDPPGRERIAAELAEADIDPAYLEKWLAYLEAGLPSRADVSKVAGKQLGDIERAKRCIADFIAYDAAFHERQVRGASDAPKAHDVNRDPDAEERRRQRHCAESVILLDESVEMVAKRYGYPVEMVERLAGEWRGEFGGES